MILERKQIRINQKKPMISKKKYNLYEYNEASDKCKIVINDIEKTCKTEKYKNDDICKIKISPLYVENVNKETNDILCKISKRIGITTGNYGLIQSDVENINDYEKYNIYKYIELEPENNEYKETCKNLYDNAEQNCENNDCKLFPFELNSYYYNEKENKLICKYYNFNNNNINEFYISQ